MKPFRLLPKYLLVGISVSVLVASASAAITYAVYSHAADELVAAGLAANDAAVQDHVRIHTEELTAGLASDIAPLVATADLDTAAKLLKSSLRRSGALRVKIAAPDGRVLLQVDAMAGRQLPAIWAWAVPCAASWQRSSPQPAGMSCSGCCSSAS